MTPDVAASVHQRLLNRARATGRPFNELLQYFVLERFLYRLGHSRHARSFILKGALMFDVWQGPFARPTRDIDLAGHTENSVERLVAIVREICQEPVAEEDGLSFPTEVIHGERITEAAEYQGVRVHVIARLGPARIPVQVDIGFGDPLVPGSTLVRLPTLLDFPPPELLGYSRESAIAEKFQAMVYLGEINSRMKDFYDIWLLAMHGVYDGPILAQALRATFEHRQTALQALPVALTSVFSERRDKQAQWRAFVRRIDASGEAPSLAEAVRGIAALLTPVAAAAVAGQPFEQHWLAGGPWRLGRLVQPFPSPGQVESAAGCLSASATTQA
jgi:hypothetical protein